MKLLAHELLSAGRTPVVLAKSSGISDPARPLLEPHHRGPGAQSALVAVSGGSPCQLSPLLKGLQDSFAASRVRKKELLPYRTGLCLGAAGKTEPGAASDLAARDPASDFRRRQLHV